MTNASSGKVQFDSPDSIRGVGGLAKWPVSHGFASD